MRIAIASDHGGFALKGPLVERLRVAGYEVTDLGAFDDRRSDYPDFAKLVGQALQRGEADRGIVLCGSGVGAAIAANKMRGIRASVCHDAYSARQGVQHDDMNVLVMGARIIGIETAVDCAQEFIRATFLGTPPYTTRLEKVERMEESLCI
jgi:ribose 5-phosphate isomerase B